LIKLSKKADESQIQILEGVDMDKITIYKIVVIVAAIALCYCVPNNPSNRTTEYILYLLLSALVVITYRFLRYSS